MARTAKSTQGTGSDLRFGFQRRTLVEDGDGGVVMSVLEAQLVDERRARRKAEDAAERLAAAVAKEHSLRMRAEKQAEAAFRQLALVRSHRSAPTDRPRRHRRRGLRRRLRHLLGR